MSRLLKSACVAALALAVLAAFLAQEDPSHPAEGDRPPARALDVSPVDPEAARAAGVTASAQILPTFTVASITPSASKEGGIFTSPVSGGGYAARNIPLVNLIMAAYRLPADRIVDGPDWMRTERYDVEARSEGCCGINGGQVPLRLQSLLRDRFGLRADPDTRQLPVYALRVARSDMRLGPAFTPSAVDCGDPDAARSAREAGTMASNGAPACGTRMGADSLLAGGITMPSLVDMIAFATGRTVQDRTGLTGRFDVELRWAQDADATDGRMSIVTAVQEQLGLTLESETAPLDVIVVREVQRPTPD